MALPRMQQLQPELGISVHGRWILDEALNKVGPRRGSYAADDAAPGTDEPGNRHRGLLLEELHDRLSRGHCFRLGNAWWRRRRWSLQVPLPEVCPLGNVDVR